MIWENISNFHHNIHINPNLLHIMSFTWMNSISFNPDFIKFSVFFSTKHYLHERLECSMLIMNTLRPTVKFHPQKGNSLNIYWKRMAHDLIQINMKIFIIWLCDAHFAVDGSTGLNVRYFVFYIQNLGRHVFHSPHARRFKVNFGKQIWAHKSTILKYFSQL